MGTDVREPLKELSACGLPAALEVMDYSLLLGVAGGEAMYVTMTLMSSGLTKTKRSLITLSSPVRRK